MFVALDSPGPKATLEDVTGGFVTFVEASRVSTVQPMHSLRELLLRRLDDEVVVIWHQAERLDVPVEALLDAQERRTKLCVVGVSPKDGGAFGTTSSHMEDAIRQRASRNARHRPTLAARWRDA